MAGIFSSIAGGKFWDGLYKVFITSGLNHTVHMVVSAIDYTNKLEKFLDDNDIKRSDPASQETLNKLKIIFKDYWDRSAQWAELATSEIIAEWEGDEYRGSLSLEDGLIKNRRGVTDSGITNPLNGKVLLATNLSNYGLASSFIHEMIHSIDVMTGVFKFWSGIKFGRSFIESRAYMETAKWENGYIDTEGQNHIINSLHIHLSIFNFVR